MPDAKVLAVGTEALQCPLLSGALARSLITTDVGTPRVRALPIRSVRTEREPSPFGVIRQEQQEICSSFGSNV